MLRAILLPGLLTVLRCSAVAAAQLPNGPPSMIDNMDHSELSVRLANPGRTVGVIRHFADHRERRFGSSAEHLVYRAAPGESAAFAVKIPNLRVLDDCLIHCWAKCSRPGLVIAANVVLPRSVDPTTGEPRRLLVKRRAATDDGAWQALQLDHLTDAVAAQARIARAGVQGGTRIDEREAYVDEIVLLAPGGKGAGEMLVDQVTVYGVLQSRPQPASADPSGAGKSAAVDNRNLLGRLDRSPSASTQSIREGFALAMQWQGEPFEQLRKLGFNVLWLGRTPQVEELQEAKRLEMSLICPPAGLLASTESIPTAVYDHPAILAWDLGATSDETALLEADQNRRRLARRDRLNRPTIVRPASSIREASRVAELLLLSEPFQGTSLTAPAYSHQLLIQKRLARPGTGVWATVQSHLDVHQHAQLAALRTGGANVAPSSYGQLTQQINASLAARPKGILFESFANLSVGDVGNKIRMRALELSAGRLRMLEPWLSSGAPSTSAACSSTEISGLVLQVERSHIIVPMMWQQDVSPTSPAEVVAFRLPGVPETVQAYLVTPAGSKRLRSRRVAGGVQIAVEELPMDGFVLATEDGLAYSQLERHIRGFAARASQLRLEMAELQLRQAEAALQVMPRHVHASPSVQTTLARSHQSIREAKALYSRRDWYAAYQSSSAAEDSLERLAVTLHNQSLPAHRSGEFAIGPAWSSLPDVVRLAGVMASATEQPTPIAGGEFEDIGQVLQSGWQRLQADTAGIVSQVRLSPEAPASGGYAVELEVSRENPELATPTIAAPPVLVRSPPLELPSGGLVEISGQVRTPQPLIGHSSALLIYESIGGRALAVRVQEARDWQPFRLVRAAPDGGTIQITFALQGLGRVQLDAIRMRVMPLSNAHPASPAQPPREATAALPPAGLDRAR